MVRCRHCGQFESDVSSDPCPEKMRLLETENVALKCLFRIQKKAQAEIPCDCSEELELAWVEVERILGE